jgi:hypothetical protein
MRLAYALHPKTDGTTNFKEHGLDTVRLDDICGLLCGSIDRAANIPAHIVWEDAGVSHTQVLHSLDPQVAVQRISHRHRAHPMIFGHDPLMDRFDAILQVLEIPFCWWEGPLI